MLLKIREARQKAGITQTALALAANVPQPILSGIFYLITMT